MSSKVPINLKGRDLEIFYRHVAGMTNNDIASDLGISPQTVSNTINSDWAKNEMALLHARTLDKIAEGTYSPLVLARAASSEAMAIQVALMRSPVVRPETRARIADSIMDRAGYRPPTRVESLDLNDVFDKMSLEETEEYATSGRLPDRFRGTNIAQFLGGGDTQEHDITPTEHYTPELESDDSTEIELE